ncbi:MAG: hypothetical protein SGILL_007666 [Bacillariaceae sp.]
MKLPELQRDDAVSPDWHYVDPAFKSKHDKRNALPTNAWYQNLLMARGEPSNLQRAYTVPYLIDVVGAIPGVRAHVTHTEANDQVMQLSFNEAFGLVLGATKSLESKHHGKDNEDNDGDDDDSVKEGWKSHKYTVGQATNLGISLDWDAHKMSSNIVRGMPFITMEYDQARPRTEDGAEILPTIAAQIGIDDPILVDGSDTQLKCPHGSLSKRVLVEKDIEFYFHASDFAWMVFFSQPAWIACTVDDQQRTMIQVVEIQRTEEDDDVSCEQEAPFVLRSVLLDQCMTNANQITCRKGLVSRVIDEPRKGEYTELLRRHSTQYPGRNTKVSYDISDPAGNVATLHFDWDPQTMGQQCASDSASAYKGKKSSMVMFALPHHMDGFSPEYLPDGKRYCKSSLTGPACMVLGDGWSLDQTLPTIDFRASRPIKPHFIPRLAAALSRDIKYKLPEYQMRGAGDTYFSGKLLVKLARILTIAEEVNELCAVEGFLDHHIGGYQEFCYNATLPSKAQFDKALNQLREGVEVWINGTAETPFVYDKTWGGVISCGCYMEDEKCVNKYPNCPGFSDQGLNFGNGFYNDHHFHYGYHISAAAAVAHFDPEWGMKHFDEVLLLVRDIANPSEDDPSFPVVRHKDWYQGSSWASGVPIPPYLNGKNQESSSEAIAAYEGVALYGQTMHGIFKREKNEENAAISKEIYKVGRLLTSTELTSAKKYWHVAAKDDPARIYPEAYGANAIGILWNTMAQFGTWFGAAGYLPIGIQLLPLTAISEERDDLKWINTIYKPLTTSCASDFRCTTSGWSILQLAVLATVGYKEEAAMRVRELPDESFTNAGGNGHSRTNTLWYISTRPEVVNPIKMLRFDVRGKSENEPTPTFELTDCYLPKTCTKNILSTLAGDFTCGERIDYLINEENQTQWDACWRVGGLEYEAECGECNPGVHYSPPKHKTQPEETKDTNINGSGLYCPPCSQEQCDSDLNRCPVMKRAFVCTKGTSEGGCSVDPEFWNVEEQCGKNCYFDRVVLKLHFSSLPMSLFNL